MPDAQSCAAAKTLPATKQMADILGMKKGALSEEERMLLENVLFRFRMLHVRAGEEKKSA
jgi:hypothetical protein